jgi:hypothetical protein
LPGEDPVFPKDPYVQLEGDDETGGAMGYIATMKIIGRAYFQFLLKKYPETAGEGKP